MATQSGPVTYPNP
jgi:hypothetical protein